MSAESNELSSNTTNAATVRFDVGGTVYRVSRSLLTQYPDTMLSRMVSETWLRAQDAGGEGQHPQDNDEPLFIDRDGERFRYVLDYMRDGQQVSLPATVSMEGLLKDMEYFGFQNVNADNIKENDETMAQVFETMAQVSEAINAVENYSTYGPLAQYCFVRIIFSQNYTCTIADDHKGDPKYNFAEINKELVGLAKSLMDNKTDWPCFDRCLEPCGLKLVSVNYISSSEYSIELTPR